MSDFNIKRERWDRIDRVIQAVLDLPPEGRQEYLAKACAGDEKLRKEVDSLLAHDASALSFLEESPSDVAADLLATGHAGLKEGQFVGRYKVIALLGVGGMGEVYLAEDVNLHNRRIALKWLPARFTEDLDRVKRFEQEARAASALNHPNIVIIHEIGQSEDTHFIVTEFIEGQTLRRRMAGKAIRLKEALDVAIQVTKALGAAHAAGIVHRDIKPENIMVRSDDGLQVKVLDFGLAKLLETPAEADDASSPENSTGVGVRTEAGFVLGTSRYMSPEQARGLKIDARTDIFSLGVVLYEMIAGRVPFEGKTRSDVLAAILKEEPPPLTSYAPKIPSEIEWIIRKALAKDLDERYQTVREFQIDLRRLKQELELKPKLEGLTTARLRSDLSAAPSGQSEIVGTVSGSNVRHSRLKSVLRPAATIGIVLIAVAISFLLGKAQSPAALKYERLTFQRGGIDRANFVPNSDDVYYSAAFDGLPLQIYRGRESHAFIAYDTNTAIQSISSKKELAVLLDCKFILGRCHNGTLATMRIEGDEKPHPVQDHVWEADWAPDGINFAIINVVDNEFRLEYPIDTTLLTAEGWLSDIQVSPDGKMVAYVDHPVLDDLSGTVKVVDSKGILKRSSKSWITVTGLAWSAKGDEILFSAGNERKLELHSLPMSTLPFLGTERLVHASEGDFHIADLSRSGRVLTLVGEPNSQMVHLTGAGQSMRTRSISRFDWSTAVDLSSDGQILLFMEWGFATRGIKTIYRQKLDGKSEPEKAGVGKALALSRDGNWFLAVQGESLKKLVRISTLRQDTREFPVGQIKEYHYASWFPDGEHILISGVEKGQKEIRSFVQDLKDGHPDPITQPGAVALLISSGGNQLVVRDTLGYYIQKYPGDGSKPVPLLEFPTDGVPIQWSEDGRELYFRSEPGEFVVELYRFDLASGRIAPITRIEPDVVGNIGIAGADPRGILITPDRKTIVYTFWQSLTKLTLVDGLR